ncbi:MAG: SusC/RagA family TonB-linked outer membrane protein [Bacteroidota bacterium]
MVRKVTFRLLLSFVFITLFVVSGFAQEGTVSGTVFDAEDGAGLPGASVLIKGTTTGTITDIDGKFSLTVEPNTVLVISYVSYQTKEITVQPNTTIDVALLSDSETLDEVIVIGYGVQKKEDKTGAVSSIEAKELNGGMVTDAIHALQGKAAGVSITKKGGDPNDGFSVRIRGASSFQASTEPLFVIDGVPGADPTALASEDILSYNILKDAASTAIYGSRGSNGVIIITTKRGSTESAKPGSVVNEVNFSLMGSMDNVLNKVDLLDADQIRAHNANSPGFIDGGANTNWQDEIYRTGYSNSAHLSFSGGNAKSYYNAALTNAKWDGVMRGTSKKRNTFRLNVGHAALDDRLRLSANWIGMFEDNDKENYDSWDKDDIIYQALQRNPTDPVYNDAGGYYQTNREFNYENPIAIINEVENLRKAKSFLGNFRTDFTVIDGLDLSLNLSMWDKDQNHSYFRPSGLYATQDLGSGEKKYEHEYQKLLEATAVYVKSFNGTHNINVLGGYSWQENGEDGFFAKGEDAQSDHIGSSNLAIFNDVKYGDIGSWKSKSNLIGFFARAQYNFSQKYYAAASLRRDGSSKFGKNNKWGWFPTASIGWNIHSEDFMRNVDWLDQLKLRASYGVSGNQEIGEYRSLVTWKPSGTATNPETGQQVVTFETEHNENPDLKWEETAEVNLGIDFSFFKGRISGSFEIYNKITKDLLGDYPVEVPPNLAKLTWGNSGELENNGVELYIQAFAVSTSNFGWKTSLNLAHNRTTINDLGKKFLDGQIRHEGFISGRGLVGTELWVIGMIENDHIGAFYLPTYVTIQNGEFVYESMNGGFTTDVSKAKRSIVGYATPDLEIGWSNHLTYRRNWHLDFSFRAMIGNDVYNATEMFFDDPGLLQSLNTSPSALDWYDEGRTSTASLADFYVEDASFLRLDYISMAYDFNFGKNHKVFKALTVYVSSNNLFTITGYSGVDPETSISGLDFGIDQYNVYPKTRTFTIGIRGSI